MVEVSKSLIVNTLLLEPGTVKISTNSGGYCTHSSHSTLTESQFPKNTDSPNKAISLKAFSPIFE